MSGQLCVVKQQAPQLFKLAQGYTPFSENVLGLSMQESEVV